MQYEIGSRKRAAAGMMTGAVRHRKIYTGMASGVVYGGKAVCFDGTDEINPDLKNVKLPTTAAEAASCCAVVPINDTHGRADGVENYDAYASGDILPYMTEGDIWVESENVVTDKTMPVFIKRANGNLTQVFVLTIQSGAAADKVYSFDLIGPNGQTHSISHTSADDDETLVATEIAALIDAVTGIGAAAVSTAVTCTAANADEQWIIRNLTVADIVLTGETSPSVGTLGSFRSGTDVVQTFTITLADTASDGKVYTVVFRNVRTGQLKTITHVASGAVEATEATALAALINAETEFTASAASAVVTVTAAATTTLWEISANADMAVVETTDSDWTRCDAFECISYEQVGDVFMMCVRVKG